MTEGCLYSNIPNPCDQLSTVPEQIACNVIFQTESPKWNELFDILYVVDQDAQRTATTTANFSTDLENSIIEGYTAVYILQTIAWLVFVIILLIFFIYTVHSRPRLNSDGTITGYNGGTAGNGVIEGDLFTAWGWVLFWMVLAVIMAALSILLPLQSTRTSVTQIRQQLRNDVNQTLANSTLQADLICLFISFFPDSGITPCPACVPLT